MMAMCSIAVNYEDDFFKPEYVLPQFMLQYMLENTSNKYIGIKYLSIKAGEASQKQYQADERSYANYVIPASSLDATEQNLCKSLSEEFSIIRNYSGKELQVWTDMIRLDKITWGDLEGKAGGTDNVIYGTNDVEFPYSRSIFARIENILNSKIDKESDGTIQFEPMTENDIDSIIAEIDTKFQDRR